MLKVLYEDNEILVAVKPAGVESQAAKRFAPDMVSEVKKHLVINKSCTPGKEPYVGVIHRLDKPVSGVMVYAKTKRAAAALSEQIQSHEMKKIYMAVVHGRPVNMVDNYVDYLVKTPDGNYSQVVDKGITGAKKAELSYEVLKTIDGEAAGMQGTELSLVRVALKTGRHHQIRVQMAHHGTPLYGDLKYGVSEESVKTGTKGNVDQGRAKVAGNRKMQEGRVVGNMRSGKESIALCASSLTFFHPVTKKEMTFEMEASGGAFRLFQV